MNPHLQQILHDITVRITKLEEMQQLQRTWVGLDHHDKKTFSSWLDYKSDDEVFQAIESKLKELNT